MTLRKNNDRALRGSNAPCPYCGSTYTGYYEAYCDVDMRTVRINKTPATARANRGDAVDYLYVHKCYRKRLPSHFVKDAEGNWVLRGTDNNDNEQQEQEQEQMPAKEIAPPPAPKTSEGLAGALESFLGASVEKIARETATNVVKETAFPVRTVVVREHETQEIPGTTHKQLADVILAAQSRNVLMVGMAGTGKSRIAQDVAKALGLPYYSLSLTSMTPASALTGMVRAEDVTRPLFREAFEHGGLFNFDEMDHAHPNILGVVNEALSNGTMAFPDGMVKKHPNFVVTATANTYGRGADRQYVGANQLDAATIDRFAMVTIEVDEALESAVAYATGADNQVVDRALELVRKTRRNAVSNGLRFLATPRSTFGICEMVRDGMGWDLAVEVNLRKGASDDLWKKLTT